MRNRTPPWVWGLMVLFVLYVVLNPGEALAAVWDVAQAFGAVLWEGLT